VCSLVSFQKLKISQNNEKYFHDCHYFFYSYRIVQVAKVANLFEHEKSHPSAVFSPSMQTKFIKKEHLTDKGNLVTEERIVSPMNGSKKSPLKRIGFEFTLTPSDKETFVCQFPLSSAS
jgi:hypothetical protein